MQATPPDCPLYRCQPSDEKKKSTKNKIKLCGGEMKPERLKKGVSETFFSSFVPERRARVFFF